MRRIKKAEKRENLLILLSSLALAAIGVVVFFVFFNKSIVLVIIGFCVTILGSWSVFKRFPILQRDEMPLTMTLLKEPQKIVWVYAMVTQRMPFGFQINQSGTMYFKMIDGNEMTLSLPASELKSISEMLNYHLPHATFGYTKEREQWYLAHPALLMRNNE